MQLAQCHSRVSSRTAAYSVYKAQTFNFCTKLLSKNVYWVKRQMSGQVNNNPSTGAKNISCTYSNSHSGPDHPKARTNSSMYPKRLIFFLWDVCRTKSLPRKWIHASGEEQPCTREENSHGLSASLLCRWSSWSSGRCQGCDLGGSQWSVIRGLISVGNRESHSWPVSQSMVLSSWWSRSVTCSPRPKPPGC